MQTHSSSSCPRCAAALPENAPQGLCPKCLLAGVAEFTLPTVPGTTPLRPSSPSLADVAAAFPQWEILDLLGQGGMGAVYKVRQPNLDRLVALKVLPAALAEVPGFAERFAREAKLLARLNHPNIVAVHEFGQAGPFFFLLMEFVDGVNLRQAMQAGKFSNKQALTVIQRVCEALQYAHDEGVLHRDIKPENILLDTKGRVKLADFGIGKLARETAPSAPVLTVSGAALGTPQYMAPEQIERPQDVDHRADIYSLGVVFYELLTGELPLGRFAAPSARAQVDRGVDEVVLRALEKERERRQQSAAEMGTEVERVEQGRPVARPGGARSRRHIWAVGLVVVATLTFAGSLGVAKYLQVHSITVQSQQNAAQQGKSQVATEIAFLTQQLQQAERVTPPRPDEIRDLKARIEENRKREIGLDTQIAGLSTEYQRMSEPDAKWIGTFGLSFLLLLLATLFGWASLLDCRRYRQETGRIAAIVTACLVPLGAMACGLVWLSINLQKGVEWKNPAVVETAGLTLAGLVWLMIAVWFVRSLWHWASRGETPAAGPRRHGFLIVTGLACLGLLVIILLNLPTARSPEVVAINQPVVVPAPPVRTHAEIKVLSVKATSPPAGVGTGTISVEFVAVVPPGHQMAPFADDSSGRVGPVETKVSPSAASRVDVLETIATQTEIRQRGRATWTLGKTGRPTWASPVAVAAEALHFGPFIGAYRADLAEAEILQRGQAQTLDGFEKKVLWTAGVFEPDADKLRAESADPFIRRGELTLGLQLRPIPTLK